VLKTFGYAISTLSVLLLGAASWENAAKQPLLLFALIAGMATSVLGMLLRWVSFLREQRERHQR